MISSIHSFISTQIIAVLGPQPPIKWLLPNGIWLVSIEEVSVNGMQTADTYRIATEHLLVTAKFSVFLEVKLPTFTPSWHLIIKHYVYHI